MKEKFTKILIHYIIHFIISALIIIAGILSAYILFKQHLTLGLCFKWLQLFIPSIGFLGIILILNNKKE